MQSVGLGTFGDGFDCRRRHPPHGLRYIPENARSPAPTCCGCAGRECRSAMTDKPPESSRQLPRRRRLRGGAGTRQRLSRGRKTLLFFAALLLLSALVAWLDPQPTLRHVNLTMLSGTASGNYHATVDKLGAEVARRHGRIRNLPSAGSVENLQRLIAAKASCEVQVALVQDGIAIPDESGLELLGRLPQPESLIILGRDLQRVRVPLDLAGLRIGIGPLGSGTEQLMRRLLMQMPDLQLVVSTPTIDQQLDMLVRGELDLGAIVIDEGAALVRHAVVERKLEILDMPDAPALARRLPFAWAGTIEAGQIDYVRRLPPTDVRVLKMDTLIVGNGCARNSGATGLLSAVTAVFPGFIQHNKGQPNPTGLPPSTAADNFMRDEGPDLLGTYAPWAADILPLPTWIKLGVALSLLFSGMAFGHRFNLWRIDVERVKIERDILALFPGTTLGELTELRPGLQPPAAAARPALDGLVSRLDTLAEQCRRKSLSILVPMGQEMSYRYQEALIAELQHALRSYRDRLPPAT